MVIKRVEHSEKNEVLKIYRSCVCQHQKGGFNQWDEAYPNIQTIENDINNLWLYGLYVNQKIVGVISITLDEPKEYKNVKWSNYGFPFLVVHRLCVAEKYLRRGIAKQLMFFAEEFAKGRKFKSIKLDTYTLNKGAVDFYSKLDYVKVGFVNFAKKTDSDYTCFEKILS